MLLQPWFGGDFIETEKLLHSLRVLNLSRKIRRNIEAVIEDYEVCGGILIWDEDKLPELGDTVRAVLGISDKDIARIERSGQLESLVKERVKITDKQSIQNICYVITAVKGDKVDECTDRTDRER